MYFDAQTNASLPCVVSAIFERLRTVLHEGQIDLRVQYMVEVMFAVRKDQFKVRTWTWYNNGLSFEAKLLSILKIVG